GFSIPLQNNSESFCTSIRSPLLPSSSSLFRRGSQTISSATRGLNRSYSHADCVPSSNVKWIVPLIPLMKSSSVAAFVSTIAAVMYLPAASRVPTTTLALCTSIATYLSLFIGLSFSVSSCWSSNYNFPPLGAPFHNAYSNTINREPSY